MQSREKEAGLRLCLGIKNRKCSLTCICFAELQEKNSFFIEK